MKVKKDEKKFFILIQCFVNNVNFAFSIFK